MIKNHYFQRFFNPGHSIQNLYMERKMATNFKQSLSYLKPVKSSPTGKKIKPGSHNVMELITLGLKPAPYSVKDKLYRFLGKYHHQSPSLKYLMGAGTDALSFSVSQMELAKTVLTSNTEKETRAAALFLLANGFQSASDISATLNINQITLNEYLEIMYPDLTGENKSHFRNLEHWAGKDWRNLRKEAKNYADQLANDYKGVKRYVPNIYSGTESDIIEVGRYGKIAKSIQTSLKNSSVGEAISTTRITSIEGEKIDLTEFKGIHLIIYIWSSECTPCQKSIPKFQTMANKPGMSGAPFKIIGLSVDNEKTKMDQFLLKNGIFISNFQIGENHRLLHDWRITGYPTQIYLNPDQICIAKGTYPVEMTKLFFKH